MVTRVPSSVIVPIDSSLLKEIDFSLIKEIDFSLIQLRKAADSGDADAQYKLGVRYEKGEGVSADPVEAAKWYKLAADQGNTLAAQALAALTIAHPEIGKNPQSAEHKVSIRDISASDTGLHITLHRPASNIIGPDMSSKLEDHYKRSSDAADRSKAVHQSASNTFAADARKLRKHFKAQDSAAASDYNLLKKNLAIGGVLGLTGLAFLAKSFFKRKETL